MVDFESMRLVVCQYNFGKALASPEKRCALDNAERNVFT